MQEGSRPGRTSLPRGPLASRPPAPTALRPQPGALRDLWDTMAHLLRTPYRAFSQDYVVRCWLYFCVLYYWAKYMREVIHFVRNAPARQTTDERREIPCTVCRCIEKREDFMRVIETLARHQWIRSKIQIADLVPPPWGRGGQNDIHSQRNRRRQRKCRGLEDEVILDQIVD